MECVLNMYIYITNKNDMKLPETKAFESGNLDKFSVQLPERNNNVFFPSNFAYSNLKKKKHKLKHKQKITVCSHQCRHELDSFGMHFMLSYHISLA